MIKKIYSKNKNRRIVICYEDIIFNLVHYFSIIFLNYIFQIRATLPIMEILIVYCSNGLFEFRNILGYKKYKILDIELSTKF